MQNNIKFTFIVYEITRTLSLLETDYQVANIFQVISNDARAFCGEILAGFKHSYIAPNRIVSGLDTSVKY